MQINDIERMPGVSERIDAYRSYVEQHPNHPVAWFNFAVDLDEARDYGAATTAANRVRTLSQDLYAKLPRRLRELARHGEEPLDEPPARSVGDYKILGVEWWSESHIMYKAVRVSDNAPVTLRRVLDLSHAHARAQFEAQKTPVVDDSGGAPLQVLPRVRGVPLLELTRGGAVDVDVAMRLVRAAGLECGKLHAAGAVHADLRPEHVVRGDRQGGSEQVTLLGARMRPDAATPWGRFEARSPEEDAGGAADARTDVYGLGLLLYQLASGKPAPSLADRNAGNLEPIAPEVDELIRRCLARDSAQRFQTTAALVNAIEDLTARRTLPAQIGKWKIGAQLGETPVGRIYAADNVDIAGLSAAVKVLDPLHARDTDARERFLAEASLASKLDHPGIARVFDGGTLADGTTYLAMERLDGPSFDALDGPLEPRRAAKLGAEAAHALAAAHSAGVVHGGLSAGSLVIVQKSGREQIKVREFGGRGNPSDDVYALGGILRDRIGASAPPALTALIERMRSEAPDTRPTMEQVAVELDAIAAGDTKPQKIEPPKRAPRPKHWRLLVAAASVVAIGVIGFAIAKRSRTTTPPVRADAAIPAADAAIRAVLDVPLGSPRINDVVERKVSVLNIETAPSRNFRDERTETEDSAYIVLAVRDDAVIRAKMKFGVARDHTATTPGGPGVLHGHEYLVWFDGGGIQASRVDGSDVTGGELGQLIRRHNRTFGRPQPGAALVTGRRWTRDEPVSLSNLEMDKLIHAVVPDLEKRGGDDAERSGTLTWVSRDGDVAEFRGALVVRSDNETAKGEHRAKLTIRVDVRRGRVLTVTVDGEGEVEIPRGRPFSEWRHKARFDYAYR
ncbi:MAG TPA: hypothetical protein VIV11_29905 [Kofleriaceae bacterium]